MCSFVPGQAVAIGPAYALQEIGRDLPGELGPVEPLVSEDAGTKSDSKLARLATVVLRTEPGLEIHAVSRMSARLARYIESREAAVDVNHLLPLSAESVFGRLGARLSGLFDHRSEAAGTRHPLPAPARTALLADTLRLSPFATREASAIRTLLRNRLGPSPQAHKVAILDSGLSSDYTGHRPIRFLDYANAGRLLRDAERSDASGHGTRVASILDRILPRAVALTVGRLPAEPAHLTALTIARALGDIVVREAPDVVNLSVALRNDWFVCPHCRQRVPAPTLLSSLLPLVIRLAGSSAPCTLTVMAAGNSGQAPNSRWLTEDVETLLFAVAENSRRERARYSSIPDGPNCDLFSVAAFGGDDPDETGGQGVFTDGTYGTSFAAPFVSASALLAKNRLVAGRGMSPEIGRMAQELIERARRRR
ncbi:S8 family serine peptidase [Massilia niastensis]|uniref:S8 family serine peptidase n=1 Tax=Massilia niastensis TaxID=544911 RepID=UPI000367B74E|nr:S8 family serine peptidase [Massilia niastensis]